MAKFMVKASELKNVCKAVNDRKLAELKKEIIEILKKQDEKDFKKATDYLNSQEEHFTHLEKSLSGKWIEKAGYGIGTVRVWKGKKYKKIAPDKWVRVFDKEGRGTNIAIGKLIAKVNKIDNVEDLMAFVMANKQRFVDENGMDLPVLDKLRAAVDAKNNGSMGSSKPAAKETSKPAETKTASSSDEKKYKQTKKMLEDKITEFNKQLKMFDNNPNANTQRLSKDVEKQKKNYEKMLDNLESEYKKISEKPSEKKKTFKQEMNELYDAQDEAWEGFESGSDIKGSPENSKKFYERVKKFVDDNKIKLSQKHYDEIEEMNGHSFNEALELAGAYGEEKKEKALAKNREYSKKYKGQILDLSMIDEFKEKEDMENPYEMTETEKKEAMKDPKTRLSQKYDLVMNTKKGTPENDKAMEDYLNERDEVKRKLGIDAVKNFPIIPKAEEKSAEKEDYKIAQSGKLATQKQVDYATEISDKYSLTREEMLKKPITAIQKYANSTVEDFDGGIDKFIEYMADGRSEGVSLDEVGKEFGKLINHNIARKIWKDYESGALEVNDDGIFEPKKETEEIKTYWIQDSRGNRLTNEDAKKRIQSNLSKIIELESGDEPRKDMKIRDLKLDNEYLKERLNPDDRKEFVSKVKKSLFDGFLGLELLEEDINDEEKDKEEESLWNDYSAEEPDDFNSTELQVREAMNRCFSNCL